jgi:membrane-associated phospholipid phosphatase
MTSRLLLLLCLCASPAAAQEPTPLRWSDHERVAGWISDAAVSVQLAASFREAWRREDRKQALGCWALEHGVGLGVNELLKRAIDRTRPDASDRKSFPSMHTMFATLDGRRGWRYGLTVTVGYGRQAAGKHYATDVLAGASLGFGVGRICE